MRQARTTRTRMTGAISTLLLGAAVAACGSDGSEAAREAPATTNEAPATESRTPRSGGEARVLGTIRATVDGEPRTWYVVDGRTAGRRYASAMWMPVSDDQRMLAVGGFDSRRPPLHTFENDIAAGRVSFGDYDGSVMSLIVSVPNDAGSLRVDLPEPGSATTLIFMPVATTDPAGTYMASSGSLELDRVSFQNGTARLEGRFEGLFQTRDGAGPIRIEEGRFEVASIPASAELQP